MVTYFSRLFPIVAIAFRLRDCLSSANSSRMINCRMRCIRVVGFNAMKCLTVQNSHIFSRYLISHVVAFINDKNTSFPHSSRRTNKVCSTKAPDEAPVWTSLACPRRASPSTQSGVGPDRRKPAYPREATSRRSPPRFSCRWFCCSRWAPYSVPLSVCITRKCKRPT